MTVNHGGNLPVEYFLAYIKLVMKAKNCSLLQAQDYIVEHFFKGDTDTFGKHTYSNFIKAIQEIS